ncbi:MAG: hypothetical protein M1832_004200 [Thelocarpon impressellum]|nr:MAG: hypothetical protein M1832_004200 [Thelocarpon impressellum]
MHRLRYYPAYLPEPETADDVWYVTCTNITKGYCCNNIFYYREVRVSGLMGGDLASTFHRPLLSPGSIADAHNRRPFEPVAKTYGCDGRILAAGMGDAGGRWRHVTHDIWAASGAMWLSCAEDLEGSLTNAVSPRRPHMRQSTLGTLLKVAVHTCELFRPGRRRRSTHDNEGVEEVDKATEEVSSKGGEASNPTPGTGCVLPDRVTVNGTLYEARKAGELDYYDAQGRMLNLTRVEEEIRPPESAVAPAPAPAPEAP